VASKRLELSKQFFALLVGFLEQCWIHRIFPMFDNVLARDGFDERANGVAQKSFLLRVTLCCLAFSDIKRHTGGCPRDLALGVVLFLPQQLVGNGVDWVDVFQG
jgi:hypothetical protein